MLAEPVAPEVDHFLADSELASEVHDGHVLRPEQDNPRPRGYAIFGGPGAYQALQLPPDGPLEVHDPW